MTKEFVSAVEKAIGIFALIAGIFGTVILRTGHLMPAVVCCYAVALTCAVYTTYLHFVHNVYKKQNIELIPLIIFIGAISICVNTITTDLAVYYDAPQSSSIQGKTTPTSLSPDRLYQKGEQIASFSSQEWQANMNVYLFHEITLLGNADMSSLFEFRDWNLLCETDSRSGMANGADKKRTDFVCRVESKR